tara:strand:- start:533 stop:1366 length:834 start_codon:yes stop_codon:yes gene_type:complete
MFFADIACAARIERAECELARDWSRATTARRPELDVQAMEFAGGVACYAGPDAPMNKVIGLGFEGVPDEAQLTAVESMYRERSCPIQIEVASLADPEVHASLTQRGYTLRSFENILGFRLGEASPVAHIEGIEIVLDEPSGLPAWLDTIVTGFISPDTQGAGGAEDFQRDVLEEIIHDMASADGFRRYIARRHGQLAAAGTMRVAHGVAHMCGASTLPEHRRRGLQTALVSARLADAKAEGAEIAVMTTQPGSKSQQNAQKQGFQLLYTRAVLVKQT